MKKLFSILFVLFSLTAFSQDIKVKQVVGAVRPYRPNVPVNGQSQLIQSWAWTKVCDSALSATDGVSLFFIHDTLFAVGGYDGVNHNTISYSTNKGATWNTYSVTWPYAVANTTSIKAKYPGDWNYIIGATTGTDKKTVIRFKDFQNLQTMTTNAEFGEIFSFGSDVDQFGNIYIVGGQWGRADTTQRYGDVWMSTAQSGGKNWTRVQQGVSWIGGNLYNSVKERNGYLYVMAYGSTFGDAGHAYSNKVKKIAIEHISDSTKWVDVDVLPSAMGKVIFGTAAIYKGSIIYGMAYKQGVGNSNELAYLDNNDQWHTLPNWLGVDYSTTVLNAPHAADMIVIGESLYAGFGAANHSFYKLSDTNYVAPHIVKEYLGVRKDLFISKVWSAGEEGIIGNGVRNSDANNNSTSYFKRVSTGDAPYWITSKTNGQWFGRLTESNSTINTDVAITTGRVFHIDENNKSWFYGSGSNYVNFDDGKIELNHASTPALRFKTAGTYTWIYEGAGDLRLYNNYLSAYSHEIAASGQHRFNQYASGTTLTGTANKYAAFDASGYLIAVDAPTGGGGGTPSLTNEHIAFGDGSNALTSSSDFKWINGSKRMELNNSTYAALAFKIGGNYKWIMEGDADLRWYNWDLSKYAFQLNSNGTVTIDPDASLTSSSVGLELKGLSKGKFPYLHMGKGSQAATSILFENSTDAGGIIEYNSTGLDIYKSGALVQSNTGSGVRIAGSSKYLNFGSTDGSGGYGIRDNAGTMQFKNNGGSWTDFGTGGGSSTFAGLTDVNLTSPSNNDIAVFDGTDWVNKTPAQVRTILKSPSTLDVQYTDAANSGTSETDLMSYTVPANTLVNNGDRLVIEAHFLTPSNANNKTLKFKFGALTHEYTPSTITSGTDINVKVTIIRTASNTQRVTKEFKTSFTTLVGYGTGGETDTSTIVLKFTGQSNTASNDITQKTMTVTYYPAP